MNWRLFKNAAICAVALIFCASCADMQHNLYNKFSTMMYQESQPATNFYQLGKSRLRVVTSNALTGMGFKYSEVADGELVTEPKPLGDLGIYGETGARYHGRLIVSVSDNKVIARAICGDGIRLLRDGESKTLEERLVTVFLEKVNKEHANIIAAPVQPGARNPNEKPAKSSSQISEKKQPATEAIELRLGNLKVKPAKIAAGGRVTIEVDYTITTQKNISAVDVEEVIVMSDEKGMIIPLKKETFKRKPGSSSSSSAISIPKSLPPGNYKFIFTVSFQGVKKSTNGSLMVVGS